MNNMVPFELINLILSFRGKHILADIVTKEYIEKFNINKYRKTINEILIDLTGGLNRANGFTLVGEMMHNDYFFTSLIEEQEQEEEDPDNDEHWVLSNSNLIVQLQGVNCRCCGNYIQEYIHHYVVSENIVCHCNI